MALEGTLKDFSVSDILQLISLQRKTGLLTLRNPDDTVTIGFEEGLLVSAESSAKRVDTRLGTLLIKTGRLSPDLLNRALEIQAQTLQRLGFILLKNGFCTAEDLRSGLDLQIRKITYSIFRWTNGDYVFDQQESIDYDRDYVSPIGVESLLMEGARMMDEWPIIEKVVRSPELVYRRVPVSQPVIPSEDHEDDRDPFSDSSVERPSPRSAHEPIKISRAEWAVYQIVDGESTVGEIIERTFLSDFDGTKAFYELVSRELISEVHVADRKAVGAVEAGPAAAAVAATIVVSVGLLFIGALSFWLQPDNPLNVVTFPQRKLPVIESFNKSASLIRLRRLAEAVDSYYLTAGKFPDSLDSVVNSGLLVRDELYDPWARAYRYVLQPDKGKYYLVGYDAEGRTDTDLFFSHHVQPASPPTEGLVGKSKKDIIIVQ